MALLMEEIRNRRMVVPDLPDGLSPGLAPEAPREYVSPGSAGADASGEFPEPDFAAIELLLAGESPAAPSPVVPSSPPGDAPTFAGGGRRNGQ